MSLMVLIIFLTCCIVSSNGTPGLRMGVGIWEGNPPPASRLSGSVLRSIHDKKKVGSGSSSSGGGGGNSTNTNSMNGSRSRSRSVSRDGERDRDNHLTYPSPANRPIPSSSTNSSRQNNTNPSIPSYNPNRQSTLPTPSDTEGLKAYLHGKAQELEDELHTYTHENATLKQLKKQQVG